MPIPDWFTVSRHTPVCQIKAVNAGLHPTRAKLANNGRTCGECGHAYRRYAGSWWWKCDMVPATSGPATDIRKKWPACVDFKESG